MLVYAYPSRDALRLGSLPLGYNAQEDKNYTWEGVKNP